MLQTNLWDIPRCWGKSESRMKGHFPVRALALAALCRCSVSISGISLKDVVWMTNKSRDETYSKRTKSPRKPWRAFPLLQRSALQESKGNLWTSKQKCPLRLSNQARLPLELRLPLTLLDLVHASGLFVLQPSDNLEPCGHEQPPFLSEGNTESPFPGHFDHLCPREPFPPDFTSGPNSMQHSNRVPEYYVYIGSPKEFRRTTFKQTHSFWTTMAMGDLDVISFAESYSLALRPSWVAEIEITLWN